eukprot:GHVL01021669.1.p1 GENE.GHVL01021669.1~~GHVL01021669.1.p1  ORF type:complete len:377 (-),score=83.38 GHVL01021669.1:53-1183(-)
MSEDETPEVVDLSNDAVVDKYLNAANIVNCVLNEIKQKCQIGADIMELCDIADKMINEKCQNIFNAKKSGKKVEKGVAFPTCISVNEICGHFCPVKKDESRQLIEGDLAKIDLGCHIDSFIAVGAHTVAVGSVTGRKADVLKAAWTAAQAAFRSIQIGKTNTDVTKIIQQVAAEFEVTPVEGVLSHQLKQHVIDGNQVIIQKENPEYRVDEVTFKPFEAYALDIIFTTGEGKPKDSEIRTTVYKRAVESTYTLKVQKARQFIADVNRRFPTLPFCLREFEDENGCRIGVSECMRHDLLVPYQVLHEKSGDFVAQFKYTVLLLPSGTRKVTGVELEGEIKPTKEVLSQNIKDILAIPENRRKNRKKDKTAGTAVEEK